MDDYAAHIVNASRRGRPGQSATTDREGFPWGKVTAVGPPLMVRLAGDPDPLPFQHFPSYTPVLGDTVGLLPFGKKLYVVGRLKAA